MKTSHEMAQSVLKKRDMILHRRRILATSIGSAAGIAAVAVAFLFTLSFTSPRGVDLVDSGLSLDAGSSPYHTFDSAEKLNEALRLKYPDAVIFEPVPSELLTALTMGIVENNVFYTFRAADGSIMSVEWDCTGNGDEKLNDIVSSNPDNIFDYETSGVCYSVADNERTFYWVQSGCLFIAVIPESADGRIISLLTEGPYFFRESSPLTLVGAFPDNEGKYRVDAGSWEVLTEYNIFRENFFGTWDSDRSITGSSRFVLDDTEDSSLFVHAGSAWLRDCYRVSGSVYAFIADCGAVSWLFWLDITAPDIMYFEEMNGEILYDHFNSGTAVLTRADEQVNQPQNDFLSVFRLREMAQEHGIDMKTLLDVEYDTGDTYALYHDREYEFYPVYLVSESDDEIVLRTKVGNMAAEKEIPAVYTLSRSAGEWTRTDLRVGALADSIFDGHVTTNGELSRK